MALITFGAAALAGFPAAHADGLEVVFDPIINAIDHSLTGADAVASLDPAASLDLSGLGGGALDQWLTLPTHSVVDAGSATDVTTDVSTASVAAAGGSAEAATTSSSDSAAAVDELFYQSLHSAEQNWINSPLGESVDNSINKDFGEYLIGNGTRVLAPLAQRWQDARNVH